MVGTDIAHAVPLALIAGAGHWYIGDVNTKLLVNLLIGSIPIAYAIGGGGLGGIVLDGRQIEEILLSATQTLMGVAILLALRFPRWGAWALLGLFAVQFAIVGTTGRLLLCGLYSLIAIGAMILHRREILPTLVALFRSPVKVPER